MRKILVVDDEPKIVQLARDYLEHAGFAVVVAHDGQAALAAARAQKPDLVVLDLGLPELDGLDVATSRSPSAPRSLWREFGRYCGGPSVRDRRPRSFASAR